MIISSYKIKILLLNFALLISIHLREIFPYAIPEVLLFLTLLFFLSKKFINENIIFIILIFIMIFYMTILHMIDNLNNIRYLVFSIYGMLIFLVLINLKPNILLHLKLFVFLSSIVSIISFTALILFYFNNNLLVNMLYTRHEWYGRSQGFFLGPNYFSITMLLPFFIAFYLYEKNKISFIWVLIIFLGGLGSMSRGLILAYFVFFLMYYIKNFSLNLLIKVLTIILLLVLVYFTISTLSIDNLLRALELRFTDGGGGANVRFNSIVQTLESLSSNNLIFGSARYSYTEITRQAPHSLFITFLADNGIIMIAILLLMLNVIFFKALKSFNVNKMPLAIFFSIVTLSFTNDYQFNKEWWFMLGLIFLIIKNEKRKIIETNIK